MQAHSHHAPQRQVAQSSGNDEAPPPGLQTPMYGRGLPETEILQSTANRIEISPVDDHSGHGVNAGIVRAPTKALIDAGDKH
ncbi:hypothetical protein Sru01_52000 [Sphaerisporangium rufum]|uniref:Uncharacterized protein n=1 Tax=Sphaerisporangium rufum TaxID=1381558 RepID=A0A919V3L7_9ACTN|nr:hypothetical protein Sru01_52000 [Sphaerisporangium rufum]